MTSWNHQTPPHADSENRSTSIKLLLKAEQVTTGQLNNEPRAENKGKSSRHNFSEDLKLKTAEMSN